MKRYLVIGFAIMMAISTLLMAGCGGGGGTTTTANTTTGNTPAGTPGFTQATVAKGEAFKLVFLTQPVGSKAFEKLAVQPVVAVVDSDGNIVESSVAPISVGLTPETAGNSTMSGILQMVAVNGVSTFTNIGIEGSGKGFILRARTSGLQDAFSVPFDVAE